MERSKRVKVKKRARERERVRGEFETFFACE